MKRKNLLFSGIGVAVLAVTAVALVGTGILAASGMARSVLVPYVSVLGSLGQTAKAITSYDIGGTVTNSLTGDPIEGALVVLSVSAPRSGTKQIAQAVTDENGDYEFLDQPLPTDPEQDDYTLGFLTREYSLKELDRVTNPEDSPDTTFVEDGETLIFTVDTELEPLGVATPLPPYALGGPANVYIEWEANPEFNLKGYRIWRTETDENGDPVSDASDTDEQGHDVGSAILLETLTGEDSDVESEDGTVNTGAYYRYQIQALSGADRNSRLSEASEPVKGQFITVFFPHVDVETQLDGLYLSDFNLEDLAGQRRVRLPVSVESAYEVGISSMQIVAHIPAELVEANTNLEIEVRTTGITAGMAISFNAGTTIIDVDTGEIVGIAGDIEIASASAEERVLYGSGTLFDIFVQQTGATGCGPLELIADDPPNVDGTRFYSIEGAIEGVTYDLELQDGELCVDNAGCLHGDVTKNGTIDQDDVQMILDLSVKLVAHNDCSPFAGDINHDGRVDAADATLLKRWIVGESISPPEASTKSVSDWKLVSYAMFNKQDPSPEVSIGAATGNPGDRITVPVTITGAAPHSGFMLTANYLSNGDPLLGDIGLTFVEATLGSSLGAGYTISANDVSADFSAKGSVLITASDSGAGGLKGAVTLVNLVFDIGAEATVGEEIPLELGAFASSDEYAHTPRHDAPGQAKIVSAFTTQPGDGSGEEGSGDGSGEEGSGDGSGEEGSGDGSGEEGSGDGEDGGVIICAAPAGIPSSVPLSSAAGDLMVFGLVAMLLVRRVRRTKQGGARF